MKVTIKDVARYSGYSVTTVSYALNGNGEIPKETKEKILSAAKELNYVPNAYARALKSKKTYNIGVYIHDFDGPVHPTIISGIASGFNKQSSRYKMIVLVSDDKLSFAKENYIDLAIIMDPTISDKVLKEISVNIPLVVFDKLIEGKNIYMSDINNEDGMKDLTNLLISKGFKKIAFVLGSDDSYHNKSRYAGYIKGLKENGIEVDDSIIYKAHRFP